MVLDHPKIYFIWFVRVILYSMQNLVKFWRVRLWEKLAFISESYLNLTTDSCVLISLMWLGFEIHLEYYLMFLLILDYVLNVVDTNKFSMKSYSLIKKHFLRIEIFCFRKVKLAMSCIFMISWKIFSWKNLRPVPSSLNWITFNL